jgi:hypothetical protein
MTIPAKKIKQQKVDFPEHQPVVPINEELEKRKKENRELAEKLREEVDNREAIIITSDGTPKKASELSKIEQEIEITRCAIDPIYFIKTYLTIFDQTQGDEGGQIVPFKLFEFQEDLIRAYMKHRFNVANKYRQAGVSTTTSAYIAWYIMFNEHRNVAIVADKLETARDEMMRDVVDFIDSCPDYLRPLPIYKDNQKHKHYNNDCQLRAFATSSLRGYTPTLLFWDETAWAERGDIFWTAARPSLQTGGAAIFVSTPNGLDPVFYKHFEGARRKENNFNAVELWWWNDPRYTVYKEQNGVIEGKVEGEFDLEWVKNKGQQDEIRIVDEHWTHEKRNQMVNDGWEATSSWFDAQVRDYNGDSKKLAQELLCSFLGSGNNFINEEYLKRIEEHEIKTPIRQEYLDNEMWIWEDPVEGAQYVIPIDVSSGHGEDYSTINILKIQEIVEDVEVTKKGITKIEKRRRHQTIQVGEYYNKVTPQTLGYIGVEYARRYNNATVVIDVTNGYGAITIEKFFEDGYDNIHYTEMAHKPTRDRLSGYVKTGQKETTDGKLVTVDLIPGFFIGNNRSSVLIELQRTINMSEVVIRSLRLLNELKTFVTVNGTRLADHKRSFHDDSIIGLSIGLFVINRELLFIGDSVSRTKKMLDAIIMVSANEKVEKKDPNLNTRTPDFRVTRENPYGANSWLFQGMKK